MFTLQALDAEGFARPLVESNNADELVQIALAVMCAEVELRIWDRKRNCLYPHSEEVCALL